MVHINAHSLIYLYDTMLQLKHFLPLNKEKRVEQNIQDFLTCFTKISRLMFNLPIGTTINVSLAIK